MGKRENDDVKKLYEFLQQARAQIADQLTQVESFDQYHLQRILAEIERVIGELQNRYTGYFLPRLAGAFDAGSRLAEAPLKTAGLDVSPRPLITPQQLEISQAYSAKLIRDITRDALAKVDGILRRAMLGESTPFQIMKQIGGVLRDRTAYELERITRTEVNRNLNLGTQQRGEEIAKELKVAKYWLHTSDSRVRDSHEKIGRETNPDFGGTPIAYKKKFTVGGRKANGPHDPSLPPEEAINCRCRLIIIPDE